MKEVKFIAFAWLIWENEKTFFLSLLLLIIASSPLISWGCHMRLGELIVNDIGDRASEALVSTQIGSM